MAEQINSNKDVYDKGILASLTKNEFDFIRDNQYDDSVNAPPSLINVYGNENKQNDPFPSYVTDRPFKTILPVIQGDSVVGFSWKNNTLGPSTMQPGDSDTRSGINTNVTDEAIRRSKLPTTDPNHISKREALFIIRARVGMEKCKIPVSKIPQENKPPNDKNEVLGRIDGTRNTSRNTTDGFGHYGSDKNNTSFNNDAGGDLSMKNQILEHDAGRKMINETNNWSRTITQDWEKPESERTIFETPDENGTPSYIIKDPTTTKPEDRWKPFYPNYGPILSNLPENQQKRALEEANFIAGGKKYRNPNDTNLRQTGTFLDFTIMARNVIGSEETRPKPDSTYKIIKSNTQKGAYPFIIGMFILSGYLRSRGIYPDSHALHESLEVIEYLSVGVKTGKNISGQFDSNKWYKYFDPLKSPFAPIGWYFLGNMLKKLALRAGAAESVALWSGPLVTVLVIVVELGLQYVQEQLEIEKLKKEAEDGGYLPGPYINTNGRLKIPVKKSNNNYKIPIGIDKDGKFIYGTDPIASIVNPQTTSEPNLGYFPDISLPGDQAIPTYGDIDENHISMNIAINEEKNNNLNRYNLLQIIVLENSKNGFDSLSLNNDFPTEAPLESPPTRGGHSGDELDYAGGFSEFVNQVDPFGDWELSDLFNFFNQLNDPMYIFYGIVSPIGGRDREYTIAGQGSDFLKGNNLPTNSTPNILNGNVDFQELERSNFPASAREG